MCLVSRRQFAPLSCARLVSWWAHTRVICATFLRTACFMVSSCQRYLRHFPAHVLFNGGFTLAIFAPLSWANLVLWWVHISAISTNCDAYETFFNAIVSPRICVFDFPGYRAYFNVPLFAPCAVENANNCKQRFVKLCRKIDDLHPTLPGREISKNRSFALCVLCAVAHSSYRPIVYPAWSVVVQNL